MLSDFVALELKVGKKQLEWLCWEKSCLQDQESTCNDCFNAFQTVMGQKCGSNRIYIWTMTRFYCKDPEFVQIICFDIALQGSYWPLAAELHWSYELMPKSYCSCRGTLQLQWDCCSWHFFLSISMNLIHLNQFYKLHLDEALSQHNGKIAIVVQNSLQNWLADFVVAIIFLTVHCLTSLCDD